MGTIPYKRTSTDDGAWDGPANEKKLSNSEADLRGAFAWVDSSMDPDTKSAYKFIHHFVGEDGAPGAASTVACSAGIAVLNGGRSGTTIPEADKTGVHAHLAHHLTDSGKDAPELKSARQRRDWHSTAMPPHPHDDMSHEHSHMRDDGTAFTHTHEHHHDDGTVGHDSRAHSHEPAEPFADEGQVGVFSARRPATFRQAAAQPSRGATERLERSSPGIVEVRAKRDGKPMICGYAAVYNAMTTIDDFFGSYMEQCGAGCFSKTLADGADVRGLWNHDPNFVLGRTKSGTLRLSEDDHGLAYEIDPPETNWARDLCETMRRGDVDGSSFGFRVIRDRWTTISDPNTLRPDGGGDMDCRTLLEVQLYDVSPVAFPAYPQTDAAVRSALAAAGFDMDTLTRVVVRTHRGLSLSGRDREAIRAAVDYLRRYLPGETSAASGAPVRTGHPPTNPRPSDAPAWTSHADDYKLFARLSELETKVQRG